MTDLIDRRRQDNSGLGGNGIEVAIKTPLWGESS